MRKKDLTDKLKDKLLSKSLDEFEIAIGFSAEDWHKLKKGLRERESNIKAILNEKAPDFSAIELSSEGEITGEKISLSDYEGEVLALIFGSYTCPVFREHNAQINQIYSSYMNKISFLHIYVYEMHSINDWFIPINIKDNVIYDQPESEAERSTIVKDWIKAKTISMPVAMDDMKNTTDSLYAGSPERLYLIDKEGVIRFRSDEGPFDDKEIINWENKIKSLIE